jgi:hypothetical protein
MMRVMATFRIRGALTRGTCLVLALVCLSGLLVSGCGGSGGPPPPKTYPVSGLVSYKGGPALPGGVIQFQSESGSTLTTMGDIGPDGTFELVTLFQNERLKGAVEGRYQVTVLPRMTGQQTRRYLPTAATIYRQGNRQLLCDRA